MRTLDDYKAEINADKVLKKYNNRAIDYCKNNIQSYAEMLNDVGLSPFDCTNTMRKILAQKKMKQSEIKRLLAINDNLILWTKILNIIKKQQPSVG